MIFSLLYVGIQCTASTEQEFYIFHSYKAFMDHKALYNKTKDNIENVNVVEVS